MFQESELDFLCRRATEELDRADAARDPRVAIVHREMATLYAEKVAALRGTMTLKVEQLAPVPQPSIMVR
jgi:hypothetical protein